MSYTGADENLLREFKETIQQYLDGRSINIPRKEKQEWGSGTSAKAFFCERSNRIYEAHNGGASVKGLSKRFSLSDKSIKRALRVRRLAVEAVDERG